MPRISMPSLILRPAALLTAGASLCLASSAAFAAEDALSLIPGDAQIVVLLDLEATRKEPELANTLKMVDDQLKQQHGGQEGLPSLMDLTAASMGLVLPTDPEAAGEDPRFYAAVVTSKDFTALQPLLAEGEMAAEEVEGVTYYSNADATVSLTPDNKALLMGNDQSLVASMIAAGDAGEWGEGVDPTAGPMESPILYIHVGPISSLGPDAVEGIQSAPEQIRESAKTEADPKKQALANEMADLVPLIEAAEGFDVYVGIDGANLIVYGSATVATEEDAAKLADFANRALAVAKEEDPQTAQQLKDAQAGSDSNIVYLQVATPKAQLLPMVPFMASMAMMQAMEAVGATPGEAPAEGDGMN